MKYGSVCSGIEAATVAWHPLGWDPIFFSEIEPFPSAVLKHHWPEVPNLGDFTTINQETDYDGTIDLLVGGTPCQSFSVAGLRGGLDDERGNLCLEFLRLAKRTRTKWLLWENVPGVLSSWSCDEKGEVLPRGGDAGEPRSWDRTDQERSDFSCFLGGLSDCGYGWAYRVLDAEYVRVDGFGRAVAQRRRRVFVVGYLGDWRPPAAVLFERACLSGNTAPSRTKGERVAGTVKGGSGERGYPDPSDGNGGGLATVAAPLNTSWAHRSPGSQAQEWDSEKGSHFIPDVSPAIKARDYKGASSDGTGDGQPIIPAYYESHPNDSRVTGPHDVGNAVTKRYGTGEGNTPIVADSADVVAFIPKNSAKTRSAGESFEVCPTLDSEAKAVAFTPGNLRRRAGPNPEEELSPTIKADSGDQSVHVAVGLQEVSPSLKAESKQQTSNGQGEPCVPLAFQQNTRNEVRKMGGDGQIAGALAAEPGAKQQNYIPALMTVRRLTPVECARLQGFPDYHCRIPWKGKVAELCPDGPQYKAYGNSMAVNAMRWLGTRIQKVEDIL